MLKRGFHTFCKQSLILWPIRSLDEEMDKGLDLFLSVKPSEILGKVIENELTPRLPEA